MGLPGLNLFVGASHRGKTAVKNRRDCGPRLVLMLLGALTQKRNSVPVFAPPTPVARLLTRNARCRFEFYIHSVRPVPKDAKDVKLIMVRNVGRGALDTQTGPRPDLRCNENALSWVYRLVCSTLCSFRNSISCSRASGSGRSVCPDPWEQGQDAARVRAGEGRRGHRGLGRGRSVSEQHHALYA